MFVTKLTSFVILDPFRWINCCNRCGQCFGPAQYMNNHMCIQNLRASVLVISEQRSVWDLWERLWNVRSNKKAQWSLDLKTLSFPKPAHSQWAQEQGALPPFGEPLFPKKKYVFLGILGPFEHFWSSSKCSLFGNYSDIYFWEWVTPPPPLEGKNSQNFLFSPIFFRIFYILNQELCD